MTAVRDANGQRRLTTGWRTPASAAGQYAGTTSSVAANLLFPSFAAETRTATTTSVPIRSPCGGLYRSQSMLGYLVVPVRIGSLVASSLVASRSLGTNRCAAAHLGGASHRIGNRGLVKEEGSRLALTCRPASADRDRNSKSSERWRPQPRRARTGAL